MTMKNYRLSVLIDILNPEALISIDVVPRIFRVDPIKESKGYFLNNTKLLVHG